ncbi:MAG: FAD-dependent oxidoreductase [Candidatus Doudnabacteria bacterium]|nr:FAD-dependent oxidoreductase [Candidatus Doudnabacteria bacterium]
MANSKYDVVIVGAGVTGTALAYVLADFSNVKSIAIIEKNDGVAQVNSHPLNNAQTSHDGSTETNYNLEHALQVQKAAKLLRSYVVKRGVPKLYKITNRMVLGVGWKEVHQLESRFREFSPHYPDLRLVGPRELAEIEPGVMLGRKPDQPIIALVSDRGFAINYKLLAECLLKDAVRSGKQVDSFFSTKVESIRRAGQAYEVTTDSMKLEAKVVVFAAGSYSLLFAQKLGYAKHLAILPVAGSFYSSGEFLKGKVYRVQIEGMPFAAIHGDPDVLNQKDTRFGPTTKPLPLMERHHYETLPDFLRLPLASFRGLLSLVRLIHRRKLYGYISKNTLYDLPWIGPRMFLKEARTIVPSIKHSDLRLRRGVGGIRPQIFNLKTGDLEMGDSSIVGDKIIFNTTPSPGASICLANAVRDAQIVTGFLGSDYRFDPKEVEEALSEATV